MRRGGDADARPVKVKCPSDGAEGDAALATGNHAASHVTQTTIQRRRQERREAREAALEFSLRLSLPFHAAPKLNSLSHDTRTCISWLRWCVSGFRGATWYREHHRDLNKLA